MSKKRADRSEHRRTEALNREHARTGRSPVQQWKILNNRLGLNLGAKIERARLYLEIHDDDILAA